MSDTPNTRVLVAEDDDSLRKALALFLESKGYEVAGAPDGNAALAELAARPCELLITDLMMPGMTGDALIASLDELPVDSRPAVILMTGLDRPEAAVKAIKAGVSAFLRKPLNMDELEVAVVTTIDRRRLDLDLRRHNEELDGKVEARTRQLTLLNRFSSVVNDSFDRKRIMDDAVEYMAESMEADAAWIYMREGEPPRLCLKASKGIPDGLKSVVGTLEISDGFSGRTFTKGGSFIYSELPGESVPIGKAVASHGFNSAMHAAIRSGDAVLGTMGVASRSGKEFQENHLQLLASFGNQIGVAMEKIWLFERELASSKDLQKKVNQLVIMNEMGNMVRISRGLEDASKSVVAAVGHGMGFDTACLWLINDGTSSMSLYACHGNSDAPLGLSAEVDKTFMSLFSETGRDTPLDVPLCAELGCGMTGYGTGCSTVVPLVVRNPDARNTSCWELFGCTEKDCPAYLNSLACWMVEDSCVRRQKRSSTLLDKMEVCKECEVYNVNMKGRIIGFICVEREGRAGGFDDDVRTLGFFANSIAAAIENIRLMEKLIKNERFIDSIMFNMSSGLMVTDLDGKIRMINYAGTSIFGVEHAEIVGANIVERFPEARPLITVESSNIGHEVVINTGNSTVPVGYSNSYLVEHEGVSDGVVVVFKDLSDIKKLQEQIRAADRFAAIGKVAAGVAHEIRNPLFGITSVAQILARETSDGTPQKTLIDAMLSEASRLNTLVEELLLYGRPTKASPIPTDIHALMDGVLEFHSAGISDKGVKVVRSYSPDLPEQMVDPHQMRQVFLNLLYNALDSIRHEGEIRLATAFSDKGARIKISDTGAGIPNDELAKVFDLFFTTKDKGTGLGLAICRKIIEDHGGSVSIQSILGKGTTVELSLPLNTSQPGEAS